MRCWPHARMRYRGQLVDVRERMELGALFERLQKHLDALRVQVVAGEAGDAGEHAHPCDRLGYGGRCSLTAGRSTHTRLWSSFSWTRYSVMDAMPSLPRSFPDKLQAMDGNQPSRSGKRASGLPAKGSVTRRTYSIVCKRGQFCTSVSNSSGRINTSTNAYGILRGRCGFTRRQVRPPETTRLLRASGHGPQLFEVRQALERDHDHVERGLVEVILQVAQPARSKGSKGRGASWVKTV